MEVDVLILFKNGIATKQEVVKHVGTAEATFEVMASEVLGEDVVEDLKDDCMYSEELYEDVNKVLKGIGMEILWLSRIKVNKFKKLKNNTII